jgi:sugar phosphate permease
LTTALGRTLPAMTAVQAVVAMGAFSLSVLAPQLGVDLGTLGRLGTTLFGVGALSSLATGWLIARVGDLPLAGLCMVCVGLAMLCVVADALGLGPARWSLWPAAVLLGLAFGPETPASAAVLSRVTPPARRPWVFSIRQTGNQIGAVAGSLLLPSLMLVHTAVAFGVVAAFALAVALCCFALQRVDGAPPAVRVPSPGAALDASGLRALAASPALRVLTATTVVLMATQVCLNFFTMSHAVRHWSLPVPEAAGWVALMQAAGLVGRLLWGRVAQRPGVSTVRLVGVLGLMMGVAGLALFLWPVVPPPAALALLLAMLGLSASGWNGVMVAEIARLAGPERAGAVSGAVLLFGYAGLALAPIGFAALGAAAGTTTAFAVLLTAATAMGLRLLMARTSPSA